MTFEMQEVPIDKSSLSSSLTKDCNMECRANEEDGYWAVVAELVREFEVEMSSHVVVQDVRLAKDLTSGRSDWICAVRRMLMSSDPMTVPDRGSDTIESGNLLARSEETGDTSARRCYELASRSPCHLFMPRARPVLKPERRSSPHGLARHSTCHTRCTLKSISSFAEAPSRCCMWLMCPSAN